MGVASPRRRVSGGIEVLVLHPEQARALLLQPRRKDQRTAKEMCTLISRGNAVLIIARRLPSAGGILVASLFGVSSRADVVIHSGTPSHSSEHGTQARKSLKPVLRRMLDLWAQADLRDRPLPPHLERRPHSSQDAAKSILCRLGSSAN